MADQIPHSTEVVVFGRSYRHFIPEMLVFVVLSIAAFYFTARYHWSIQYVELGGLTLPIPVFFLPPFLVFVYIGHHLIDARYVVGPDFVRAVKGLYSFQKRDVQIELAELRGIELERPLWGRIVNTGDLVLVSAVSDQVEIHIEEVYDPSYFRDLILQRKRHLQPKSSGD